MTEVGRPLGIRFLCFGGGKKERSGDQGTSSDGWVKAEEEAHTLSMKVWVCLNIRGPSKDFQMETTAQRREKFLFQKISMPPGSRDCLGESGKDSIIYLYHVTSSAWTATNISSYSLNIGEE